METINPKHLRIAGYLLAALFFALVITYFYKYVKKKFAELETKGITPLQAVKNATVNANAICTKGNAFPLSQGSCGSNVVSLQVALNKYAKSGISNDGKFGPKTKSALAAAMGKTSITLSELQTFIKNNTANTTKPKKDYFGDGSQNGSSGSWDGTTQPSYNAASYPTDLRAFAIDVQTDLDKTYMLGSRKNTGVWAQLLLLNPADLKTVATYIRTLYGTTLYSRVSMARWDVTDDVNVLIKNKLIAAGVGE